MVGLGCIGSYKLLNRIHIIVIRKHKDSSIGNVILFSLVTIQTGD